MLLILCVMETRNKISQAADDCVQCGACRPVCPIHRLTRREEHAPRGKLKLYQALISGKRQVSADNIKPLAQCLLCGRCQKNCPSKIEVTDALKLGRAWLQRKNLARMLGKVLLSPVLPKFMQGMWPIKRVLSQGLDLRLKPLRRLPALRLRPPSLQPVSGPQTGPRMALFLGCMGTYARPGLAEKALKLLAGIGQVQVLSGCCGLAAQSAGDLHSLRRAADNLYKQCAGHKLDFIVTMCTSCAHSISHEHRTQYAGLPPVKDISQLLADYPQVVRGRAETRRVNLHLSCHLDDVQALTSWLGVAEVEFKIIDACCGGGGLLPLSNLKLSMSILPALPDNNGFALATTCSGCYVQWLQSSAVQVLHPIELLA